MQLKADGEGLTCFCLGHCPDNKLNGTCVAPPGAPCFSGDKIVKIVKNIEI